MCYKKILKNISFHFSDVYRGTSLTASNLTEHAEDICFTLDCTDQELTVAEAKATYAELKKFILDISDRHYDRKYQDMQERLDNLYDKINDVEDSIADVNQKITAAYGEHITAHQLYRLLEHFDKLYEKMTDLEKKEFFQNFIESIEIHPDRKANERILKQIRFRFPVYYNGASGDIIRLRTENAD